MQKVLNYIGGELVSPSSQVWFDKPDPATGAPSARVPDSDEADIQRAVEAAGTGPVALAVHHLAAPERAERLSQMYRDAALTGEARQMAIMGLAVAIGAFVVYLTMTRR